MSVVESEQKLRAELDGLADRIEATLKRRGLSGRVEGGNRQPDYIEFFVALGWTPANWAVTGLPEELASALSMPKVDVRRAYTNGSTGRLVITAWRSR